MTFRVLKIDDALVDDHRYLEGADECYYLVDYLSRQGFGASEGNSLISNLKKSVAKKGLPEYRYKNQAILKASHLIKTLVSPLAQEQFSFVPVPPSKQVNDPLYDDRLTRILATVRPALDVREVLRMKASRRAHHEYEAGERRPDPDDIYANLDFDDGALAGQALKQQVFVFDDVLTNGAHFKACQRRLLEHRPDLRVVGLFIGRSKRSVLDFPLDDIQGL